MTSNLKEILLKDKNKALYIDNKTENTLDSIAQALKNNIKIIHFFIKNLSDKKNIELAFKIRQLCSIYDSLFIINSRADIAKITNADGICLNKNDINIEYAKDILGNDKIFCYFDDDTSYNNDFDYICSFENSTKKDYKFIRLIR